MVASDSLGNQFGGYQHIVEHVPIEEMKRFKDPTTNREAMSPGLVHKGPDRINELAASIKEHGIKEPLMMNYGPKHNRAYLAEGHHRLAAAEKAGHKTVPVRVHRDGEEEYWSKGDWGPGRERGVPVPGAEPDEHGHVRRDLRPSEIGIGGHTEGHISH